jgi:hypothetical protein
MNAEKMLEQMRTEHEELGIAIKYMSRLAGTNGRRKALRHAEQALAMTANNGNGNGHTRERKPAKQMTQVEAIREILKKHGKPMTGPELFEELGRLGFKISKAQVSVAASQLGREKRGVKRVKDGWVAMKNWTPPEAATT